MVGIALFRALSPVRETPAAAGYLKSGTPVIYATVQQLGQQEQTTTDPEAEAHNYNNHPDSNSTLDMYPRRTLQTPEKVGVGWVFRVWVHTHFTPKTNRKGAWVNTQPIPIPTGAKWECRNGCTICVRCVIGHYWTAGAPPA